MEALAMVWILVAMVFLCGLIATVVPFFMPKGEVFTVTVPETAHTDARFAAMRRSYAILVLIVTVICTILAGASIPLTIARENTIAFAVLYLAFTAIPLLTSFVAMLKYRGRVLAIKQLENWKAPQKAAATFGENAPEPISLRWNLLYLPVLLASAALTWMLYPSMPDMLPMQAGFDGTVTTWTEKTPLTASFALFVDVFMMAVLIFSHWSINVSKKAVNPKKPAQSGYAYGQFARIQSMLILGLGMVLCLLIGILIPLSNAGFIGLMDAALIIVLAALGIVIVTIVVFLKFGQSGSRVFEDAMPDSEMAQDDDKHWILGIFYFDRNDASMFLPRRFGFGWTLNLGSPKALAIIGALILVCIVFGVVCATLFS